MSLARILAVVGVVENGSEHPLGSAVVKYAKAALGAETMSGRVGSFNAVPGCGLGAKVSGIDAMVEAGLEGSQFKNYKNIKSHMPYK
jgi:cation transport ATPase